jgi:hypothetical protein
LLHVRGVVLSGKNIMKICNWCKKLSVTMLAAGWLLPVSAQAVVNIPLGDPSFEQFVVSSSLGYAYAGPPDNANTYRPDSAWISRIDDNINGANFQDGGAHASNWIYNAAYAELVTSNPNGGASNPGSISMGRRPAPRTGNQAMHGRGHFNGQEISATFEAGKQYTFSIYAQGDSNAEIFSAGWQSRVYLFLYDATIPFRNPEVPHNLAYEDPNAFFALTYDPSLYDVFSENYTYFPPDRFAPDEPIPPELTEIHPGQFINRPENATAAQSRAAWQQISVSWLVVPGAPEVGHSMGVAFRVLDDGAVDDAALTATGAGPGDLNLDDAFTAADWSVIRSNQHANLSSLTAQQKYLAGDLNGDGFNNHADFVLFKTAYDQTNGPGSFAAMLSAVPEPGSLILFASAAVPGLLVRRRPV